MGENPRNVVLSSRGATIPTHWATLVYIYIYVYKYTCIDIDHITAEIETYHEILCLRKMNTCLYTKMHMHVIVYSVMSTFIPVYTIYCNKHIYIEQ